MISAEQERQSEHIQNTLRTPAIDEEDLRNKILQSVGHSFHKQNSQEINSYLLQYFMTKEYSKKQTVEISTQTSSECPFKSEPKETV